MCDTYEYSILHLSLSPSRFSPLRLFLPPLSSLSLISPLSLLFLSSPSLSILPLAPSRLPPSRVLRHLSRLGLKVFSLVSFISCFKNLNPFSQQSNLFQSSLLAWYYMCAFEDDVQDFGANLKKRWYPKSIFCVQKLGRKKFYFRSTSCGFPGNPMISTHVM